MSDNECRDRAAVAAQELRREAAELTENKQVRRVVGLSIDSQWSRADPRQVLIVTHYDFICGFLDELVLNGEQQRNTFKHWRNYNTSVTVVDITRAGEVIMSAMNSVCHLTQQPALISGFNMM
jgi:hypothetical protein